MKVLIPIKRVVDPYTKVRPLAGGLGIDTEGIKFEINPFDEIAVEEAVRLREKHGDVDITVVSLGGPEAEEQLRKALAMGADRAILIEATGPIDSPAIARELERLARDLAPDLILMGKQATDDDNNQVAQMLAARLDWPQATFAAAIQWTGSTLEVRRETDLGEETLSMELPAVVTADLRLNEPRYVALPGIIKARAKPLTRQPSQADLTPKTRTVHYDLVPPRAPGRKVGSVEELIGALKDRGVLA